MQSMSGDRYFERGLVTSNRSDLPLRLDPRLAITHYFSKPVTDLLEERPGAELIGETTWEGHKALQLASVLYDNDDDDRRYHITVVPDMNYAIVRRATAIRQDGLDRWDDYTRITTSDYFEAQPGFWLPRRALHESFETSRDQAVQGTDPDIAWRWDIQFSDWQLNPEISDSLFGFKFASGVYVNDQVVGRSYKMAGVSDELLDSQLAAARAWKSRERQSRSRTLVMINLAVLAVLLGIGIGRNFFSRRKATVPSQDSKSTDPPPE
jgi:hypothetical protein